MSNQLCSLSSPAPTKENVQRLDKEIADCMEDRNVPFGAIRQLRKLRLSLIERMNEEATVRFYREQRNASNHSQR